MKFFFWLTCFLLNIGCTSEKISLEILQPKSDQPDFFKFKEFQFREQVLYVPATPGTVKWGYVPNANDNPIASMESGSYLVIGLML